MPDVDVKLNVTADYKLNILTIRAAEAIGITGDIFLMKNNPGAPTMFVRVCRPSEMQVTPGPTYVRAPLVKFTIPEDAHQTGFVESTVGAIMTAVANLCKAVNKPGRVETWDVWTRKGH